MVEPPKQHASVSGFERLLLSSTASLALAILDFVALREVYVLSKLNKNLSNIVHYYADNKWRVINVLNRFFDDTQTLLDFMEDENAIIFGCAVLRFLDRTFDETCTSLDLCIHVESTDRINIIMQQEGFVFKNSACLAGTFKTAVEAQIPLVDPRKLKSSGERNSSEMDRSPWGPYDFGGENRKQNLRVRIHVVRCNPYRHIMSFQSTALMNYISWNCLVSLFPNSAFLRRRSFVSRQEDLSWRYAPEGFHAWFDEYADQTGFKIIGLTHRGYKEVEKGERFIGDKFCWVIPVAQSVPSSRAYSIDGPSFEVLDYIAGTTRADSYMRIGEPELWSQWNTIRCLHY